MELFDIPEMIYTQDGTALEPGRVLGHGGEGQVCLVRRQPELVIKLLNPSMRIPKTRRHLEAVMAHRVPELLEGIRVVSLPRELVFDERGDFLGFTMSRIRSQLALNDLWLKETIFFRSITVKDRYAIAYNLAEAVDHLHRHGLIVGDLNPRNVALNADGTVTLLDLGSCCVTDPITGEQFRSAVCMADYMAPECSQQSGSPFTAASDCFALAILIFQIITGGCHPFNTIRQRSERSLEYSRAVSSLVDEIVLGSPYFTSVTGRRVPDYAVPYLDRLYPLQDLFDRVFCYSAEHAADPQLAAQRPSAAAWMRGLQSAMTAGETGSPTEKERLPYELYLGL